MKMKNVISAAIRLICCFVLIIIMTVPNITFAAEMRESDPEDIVTVVKHYLIETVDDVEVVEDDQIISRLDENAITAMIFDGEEFSKMNALEAAGALWECGGLLKEFTEDTLDGDGEYADLTVTFGVAFIIAYLSSLMIYSGFILAVIGAVVTLISLILALCGKSMGKDSLGNLTQGLWSVFGGLALAQPLISLAVNVFFQRINFLGGDAECRFRIFFEGGAHYLVALIVALLVTVIGEAVVKKIFSKESD